MNKKTTLLFCPAHVSTNGLIWQLLHISKEKNILQYNAEPLSVNAAKKYFPLLPNAFFSTLNHFSEKNMAATRQEITNLSMRGESKPGDHTMFFERKLHQHLMALKPLLPLVQCYHSVPVPEDKKRVRTAPCVFSNFSPGLRFRVRLSEQGYFYLDTEVELNGSFYPLEVFNQHGFLLEHKNEYFILRLADYRTLNWVQQLKWQQCAMNGSSFEEKILSVLEQNYSVDRNSLINADTVDVIPEGRIVLSELSGQFLMLTPQFDYDGFVLDGPFKASEIKYRDGKEYSIVRHRKQEETILQQIVQLHPKFVNQNNGYYYLSFDEAQKKGWFLKAFRQLLDLNIRVLGMDMLKHFRYCTEKPVTELHVLNDEGVKVQVSFSMHFGGEVLTFSELQKVIRAGEQAVLLKDGTIALLDEEWMARYALIVKHAVSGKHGIHIPKWLIMALQAGENEKPMLPVLKQEWQRRWHQWQQSDDVLYALPETVDANLRIYQQKGYEWMRLLDEAGAGIFLADDMGLGKTLQAICFLAHVLKTDPAKKILIVCPASLIYNWQHELTRFTPSLHPHVYHGAGKTRDVFSDEKLQVIISSYGTLRSDSAIFTTHHFSTVVLDESHTIKNPSSQIAQVVHMLSADRRMVLSGTPVMNNTVDLYSQLNFVLPGMFVSREFFKREYADPIDRDKNEQRVKDLQKLTSPFILRRTKEQVARDLPPKTETTLWCQMEDEQRRVYDEIRSRIRGEIQSTIKEKGLQKSKLQVLQGILKLRQVCNSPVLLNDNEFNCTDSIKTAELMEEIGNNLSDHKALVFSQFTSMIDILSEALQKKKIPHLVLTGSTPAKERDRLVQEFNSDKTDSRIFLLSLKAGNAGLNLTAADYVFLFDPWWNSAVEQQAIDRTHRIGQTKSVFAYKLICKDTIEEKIVQLQLQKKNLASELVQEDNGFVKDLTEDDIGFLFG